MIHAWGITDKGAVRTQNQDGFYLDVPSEHLAVGVVCDGMGGAKAGNIASLIAVETFVDALQGMQPDGDGEAVVGAVPAQTFAAGFTVEIVEGPGTVNGNSDRESEAMKPDQTWKWTPMSVKLYGVTAATRIAIRSTQQGNPGVTAGEKGYFRWYLDNVKIVKAPRN